MAHKLVLIDGHALAYRMFFALPVEAMTTKKGEPTNATYGFIRAVLDLMFADDPPDYLAVTFDVGKTFRDDIFPAYKGTREKMPDDLRVQIERIQEVLETLAVPQMLKDGYEADDVIGTIARLAKEPGVPVHIITGDRDLLQLVDETTTVELPPTPRQRQARIYDVARVEADYGITPLQIIDWKALEGDKSDNIPGVRGVGKKTSERLLQKYGTLDEIYAHLDELQPRWRNKLEADKENAYLSQKLATIVRDVPVELDLSACEVGDFDGQAVLDIFRLLEFRHLTDYFLKHAPVGDLPPAPKAEPTDTITVRTPEQLAALVADLNSASMIAFDVETTGLNKLTADVVGICLATQAPTAYYIPIGHVSNPAQAESGQMGLFAGMIELEEDQLTAGEVLDAIRPAMTNPDIPKVAHNAKFDYMILHRAGLTVAPIGFDTMLGEWLANPSSKHLGLKDLTHHRLGIQMQPITDLIGTGKKNQRSFAEVAIEDAAPYGSADADMTLRLVPPIQEELAEKALGDLLALELELLPILADMEFVGIGIDTDYFAHFAAELKQRLAELETDIHEIAGRPFNINSTQQLSDVLFTTLQLPTEGLRKTKSGHYSTASGVLEGLKKVDEDGIVTLLMEYRELGKLKSTYVDSLPDMVNGRTGRIHTSFNQTGASTGRLSSNSPNLQNIPIRTETGRRVRRGFVAAPGKLFVAADYSQVELRILAHVSQDEALMGAFLNDLDVHKATAAAVYNVPLDEVDGSQRRFAKAVNFGLMYGMGPYRLSATTDMTLAEAENFIKMYFEQFPGVRGYLDETKVLAKEQGYVETLLGRRQYYPQLRSTNQQAVARAERAAINHPIQGTAADIIKRAMITLHGRLAASPYDAKMLLQVHDELILEVAEAEVEPVMALMVDTMSNAYKLDVPLKVEAASGTNWYELKG